MDFLKTVYGQLAAIAAAAGTIWGLTKAVGALRSWIDKKVKAHRDRLDLPIKTLEAVNSLKADSEKSDRQIAEKLIALGRSVEQIGEQTATLQNHQLCEAYMTYGVRKTPIPFQTKLSLERMYIQYRNEGGSVERNHVPADWMQVMSQAPVEGAPHEGSIQ